MLKSNKFLILCVIICCLCVFTWIYIMKTNSNTSKELANTNPDNNIEESDSLVDLNDNQTDGTQNGSTDGGNLTEPVINNENNTGNVNNGVTLVNTNNNTNTNNNNTNTNTNNNNETNNGNNGGTGTGNGNGNGNGSNPAQPTYVTPTVTFTNMGDTNQSISKSFSIVLSGDYVDGSLTYKIINNDDGVTVLKTATGSNISISNITGTVFVQAFVIGKDGNTYTNKTGTFNMLSEWPDIPFIGHIGTSTSKKYVPPVMTPTGYAFNLSIGIEFNKDDFTYVGYAFAADGQSYSSYKSILSKLNYIGSEYQASISEVYYLSTTDYAALSNKLNATVSLKLIDKNNKTYLRDYPITFSN